MKKLIFKCVFLILLTGGILYVGGMAYRQTNTYRNLEIQDGTDIFHTMPESIDIAVFGPSHGREDFVYPPEGKTFFNFALSSQTPQYDEKLMAEYQTRFHEGTMVVLTISYLSPYWTDAEDSFQQKQPRYYRILSPQNIVDVNLSKYLLQASSPLLTEDLSAIASAFLQEVPLQQNVHETRGKMQFSPENVSSEKERIIRNHWNTAIAPSFPSGNAVMLESIRDMLTQCQANGWKAVLVTPPYTSAYNECFPPEFFEEFYNTVNQFAQEFQVPYLDYSHEAPYGTDYTLFSDIDHLNLSGAEAFNQQFFMDLQSLGLL